MALTEDEKMGGGLMNAITAKFGKPAVDRAIKEMPAREANDAHRAVAIGKQMKKNR
jgi:hypothetical protein